LAVLLWPLTWPLLAAAAPSLAGWSMRRVADLDDGGAAFVVLDPTAQARSRIHCPRSAWALPDDVAARLLDAPEVMAAVLARQGALRLEDLGPVRFECVIAPSPQR
jgi:hypothetical protein